MQTEVEDGRAGHCTVEKAGGNWKVVCVCFFEEGTA